MNRRGAYWMNLLKGFDYGIATLFGIPAGIYISAYVRFKEWGWAVNAINLLFSDDRHCDNALAANRQDIEYYYGGEQCEN